MLRDIEDAGYLVPTAIQQRVIPFLRQGRDVIGFAQVGTGKTAFFVLPILHRIQHKGRIQVLILVPNRELALEVDRGIGASKLQPGLRSLAAYDGVKTGPQVRSLQKGVDLLVATPHRLLELYEGRHLEFGAVKTLVLDDMDRMVDMGLIPTIRQVLRRVPRDRQTSLYSATMPSEVRSLSREMLRDPVTVGVPRPDALNPVIHRVFPVPAHLKEDLLFSLLEQEHVSSTYVFARTRGGVDRIAKLLRGRGLKVSCLDADRTQEQRRRALDDLKRGKVQVLISTEVAVRGLDVEGVSHVYNFEVPDHPDAYANRIGRTAQAGDLEKAVILMAPEEVESLKSIEQRLNGAMVWAMQPDFDYGRPPSGESRPVRTSAPRLSGARKPPVRNDPGRRGKRKTGL